MTDTKTTKTAGAQPENERMQTPKGSFENPFSLIEACEVGSESAAREVERIIAQRDELLEACKLMFAIYGDDETSATYQVAEAIAKAEGSK